MGGRRAWQNRKLAFLEAASLYLDGREDVAAQADGLAALGHLVTVPEAPINIANPVMLCVDPETGEMEEFHSEKLKDDLPSEEEESCDVQLPTGDDY